MKNIIEITNLNKSFKDVKAVQNLSFKVKEGELFAFLGLNGAGKSTTISIICGQLKKDSGTVLIDGNNIDKSVEGIKNELGVVFQNSVLDKPLTVKRMQTLRITDFYAAKAHAVIQNEPLHAR